MPLESKLQIVCWLFVLCLIVMVKIDQFTTWFGSSSKETLKRLGMNIEDV